MYFRSPYKRNARPVGVPVQTRTFQNRIPVSDRPLLIK